MFHCSCQECESPDVFLLDLLTVGRSAISLHCSRQLAQWLIIIKKMSLCKKPATNSRDTPLTTEWMKDEMQFITHTFQENCRYRQKR